MTTQNNFAPTCINFQDLMSAIDGIETKEREYEILHELCQKFVNIYEMNGTFLITYNHTERFIDNEFAQTQKDVACFLRENTKHKPKKMQMIHSNGSKFWFVKAINQHEWVLTQNYEQALRGEGNIEKVKFLL